MPDIDPAEAAYHAARDGTNVDTLIWVTAKNKSTGAPESLGLWTGADHQEFVIDGEARTYFASSILDFEPIEAAIGLNVQMHEAGLAALTPAVEDLLHGYDARLAPVEIHRVVWSLENPGSMVAEPHRIFSGEVNEMPMTLPAEGGAGKLRLVMASAARGLTRGLALFKSDAAMRLRNPNDAFREYTDVSGESGDWWGEKHAEGDGQ